MARPLTKKREGFVRDYVMTGIGSTAVKKNYKVKNDETARTMASELLTFPNVIEAIAEVKKTVAEALTEDLLLQVHLDGLEATRSIAIEENTIEVPDYAIRHKYLDSAYKIKGSYAPEKHQNLNINIETPPQVAELTKQLNDIYKTK